MKLLKRLANDRVASTAVVVSLIGIVVAMIVGLVVTGNLYTIASNMDLGSSGNSTRTTLFSNVYSAFNLTTILPIIIGASAIIAVVYGFARQRQ